MEDCDVHSDDACTQLDDKDRRNDYKARKKLRFNKDVVEGNDKSPTVIRSSSYSSQSNIHVKRTFSGFKKYCGFE